MNRFFDLIDKYKYGIITTFAVYIFIFIYLQMNSYTAYYPIEPFHDGAVVEKDPEIELKKEQIEVSSDYHSDLKNMARNQNDTREKSYEDYSENKPSASADQSVKEYEKKLFEESGGAAERERIRQAAENDKKNKQKTNAKNTTQPNQNGGNKSYAGNVMVEWELGDRIPHQNNNWYVRNPGYNCGVGSNGTVVVNIRVNQNGDVVSAIYNPSRSSSASPCMVEQAQKYAKMSRFAFSSNAPKLQEGIIVYRFVSQ